MNYVRSGSAKGQIKCFQCRAITKSKDGGWEAVKSQQVFVCKTCKHEAMRKVAAETLAAQEI